MMHPDITYDIASEHRKAMLAQAATSAQVRAAHRAIRSSRERPSAALLSRVRQSLRPRTA
jgi:hypothetical protein